MFKYYTLVGWRVQLLTIIVEFFMVITVTQRGGRNGDVGEHLWRFGVSILWAITVLVCLGNALFIP